MKHLILISFIFFLIGCTKDETIPTRVHKRTYTHWVIKGKFNIERYYSNGFRMGYEIKDSAIIDTDEKIHMLIWKEGKPSRLVILKDNKIHKDTICTRLYVEYW